MLFPSRLSLLLCAVAAVARPAAAAPSASVSCPDVDWTPFGGMCYWWTPEPTPWVAAAQRCRDLAAGASLVSVHSDELNAFLGRTLLHGFPTWLGLSREGDGEEFKWEDGTPLDYEDWQSGEPSGDGQLSAYINADPETGEWAAFEGSTFPFPFMCQVPAHAGAPGELE